MCAHPDPQCPNGEDLLNQVYHDLRRVAAAKLAREKPGQTLQPTALVHEAWLRLEGKANHQWASRTHFFAAAAEAMRRILVDKARRKARPKHGGHLARRGTDIGDLELVAPLPDEELLAVDEALDCLETENPRAAEVVKLRYFAGLTEAEVAGHLGISRATVERIWAFARAWLFRAIRNGADHPPPVRDSAGEKRME